MARNNTYDEGPKFCTPVGTLVWPHLNLPRQYEGEGKFSYDTGMDFSGPDGEHMATWVKAKAKEIGQKTGQRIKVDNILTEATEKNEDGSVQTLEGVVRVKFKVANIETKKGTWDRKPAFWDPQGTPITPEPMVGGGTQAQIFFTVYEWKTGKGFTLQPRAVMIHKLVEYVPRERGDDFENVQTIGATSGRSQVPQGHPADF